MVSEKKLLGKIVCMLGIRIPSGGENSTIAPGGVLIPDQSNKDLSKTQNKPLL